MNTKHREFTDLFSIILQKWIPKPQKNTYYSMKITIGKFQELFEISNMNLLDAEKYHLMLKSYTGLDDNQFKKLTEKQISKLIFDINNVFSFITKDIKNIQYKKRIFVNNKWYKLNYDITEYPNNTARYVESITFADDFIRNLHKILASMTSRLELTYKGFKPVKSNEWNHEQVANDMLDVDFVTGYSSAVKFIYSIKNLNEKYKGLFDDGGDVEDNGKGFSKDYIWLFNAKSVAEFEQISIDEVWELPIIQFLNDLGYLKYKNKWDADKYKEITKKSR
jgi:hypothetical protein